MPKKIYLLWILFIAVLIAGAAYVLINRNADSSSNENPISQENESLPINISSTDDAPTSAPVEEATLETVRNPNESGMAERTVSDNGSTLTVAASLDQPAEGKFYEGWLVGGGKVISTGKLVDQGNSQFTQTFESESNLSDQKSVVVTEETLANGLDNKPEAHVLEGSF